MIRQVQRRFFRIALAALTAAMLLVTGAANLANWINVRMELEETLESLSAMESDRGEGFNGHSRHMKGLINESRFFIVTVTEDGAVTAQRQRMQELTQQDVERLTALALAKRGQEGFVEEYLFSMEETEDGDTRMVFLNCETRLEGVRRLLAFSLGACALGIGLAWVFVARASRRAIAPLEDNMRRQKRFITDASHELKTPLTVISANMDVLEMDLPDNPWVQSTRRQTAQMQKLVQELVYLTRMEEADAPLHFAPLELKPALDQWAEPFTAMAEFRGQTLTVTAPDHLTLDCDAQALARLVTILCDNALKYAPEGDSIRLTGEEQGKYVSISTENGLTEPLTREQCSRLFDRFYRGDPSRSKDSRGGFGIGLATAAAIAEQHGGRWSARLLEGERLEIQFQFPKKHS